MRHLTFLLIILLVALSFSAHAAPETRGLAVVAKDPATGQPTGEVKLYNKAWAVFIGIDRYQEPGIPRLKNAVNDARGVKKVLQQRFKFDDYRELYDEKATRKNIVELFQDELAEKVAEDDAVFVFWAGHGTQQENSRFGELGYLIPYDGSWKKHSSNLSMETLKSEISKSLKARHVFYVMDACYGGLMADKRNINQKTLRDLKALQQIAKEDVRQVLTAGSKGEQVLDGTNGHSVFTWRLIEALEAAGDFITANEIQAIITRNVASDALKSDHKQTPQYGKLYGQGDFVFVPSKEYQLAEKQAEVDSIGKQVEQTRRDNDRIRKQMADDEAIMAAALKAGDESKRQAAELDMKRKQGLLRLEEAKQKEREDQLRRAEQEATELKQRDLDRQRIQEEARRQQARVQESETRQAREQAELEKEQQKQKAEEERKNAELRRMGEEKRKKALEAFTATSSIEAAIEDIRKADAEIVGINRDFDAELARQKAGADSRLAQKKTSHEEEYDKRMQELKNQTITVAKPVISPRDEEFETQAAYRARVQKTEDAYNQRLSEARSVVDTAQRAEKELHNKGVAKAEAEYRDEMYSIEYRITSGRAEAIKPFRERITTIAAREYPVSLQSLKLTVGKYDPDKGFFPVSIASSSPSINLSVAGTLPMPLDAAKLFKQQYTNGLVRPEAIMKTGSSKPVRLSMINDGVKSDADGYLLEYVGSEFITLAERKRRSAAAAVLERERKEAAAAELERKRRETAAAAELERNQREAAAAAALERERREAVAAAASERNRREAAALERDRMIYKDPRTGLMWTRNANISGMEMNWNDAMNWAKKLNYGGYRDWRLPTKEELRALVKRGGDRPSEWFSANGFSGVQANYYWSSSSYAGSTSYAWGVGMGGGGVHFSKTTSNYVWSVRAGR